MKLMRLMALILTVALLITGMTVLASAETNDYYASQVARYEDMRSRTISLGIIVNGPIVLKTAKICVREVTGVAPDGSFILGPWKVVHQDGWLAMGGYYSYIPATYVMFGYSVDILGGTDWPFSGIFWTDVNQTVNTLSLYTGGTCRMVDVDLQVNKKTVYSRENCSSHNEWNPI